MLYLCQCGNSITCGNMPRRKFVKKEYMRDGDYFDIFSHHCKVCWRRVPETEMAKTTRPSVSRRFAPGLLHFYIDEREVSEAEWNMAREARAKAAV